MDRLNIKLPFQGAIKTILSIIPWRCHWVGFIFPRRCRWAEIMCGFQPFAIFFTNGWAESPILIQPDGNASGSNVERE